MISRLLADADFKEQIVAEVVRKNPSIDFRRAKDAGLKGVPDLRVLEIAAQESRVLVSHDVNTMPGHLRDFVRGATSPGVILVPQLIPIGVAVESLLMICEAGDAADLQNCICRVPNMFIYHVE